MTSARPLTTLRQNHDKGQAVPQGCSRSPSMRPGS